MWFLDMLSSFVGASVAIVAGDFEALFSEAARDNGRLLEPVDPRDEGRRCHGSVPAREGVNAVLGTGWEVDWGCDGGCGSSRCKASDPRAPFVLRDMSSKSEELIDGGWKNGALEKSCSLDISFAECMEPGVPKLEGASLVGEIDLARSVRSH